MIVILKKYQIGTFFKFGTLNFGNFGERLKLNQASSSILSSSHKIQFNVENILSGISDSTEISEGKGNLLFNLATKITPVINDESKFLTNLILEGKISSPHQLDAIVSTIKKHKYEGFDQPAIENEIRKKFHGKILSEETIDEKISQSCCKLDGSREAFNSILKFIREEFPCISPKFLFDKVKRISQSLCPQQNSNTSKKLKVIERGRALPEFLNSKGAFSEHVNATQGKLRFRFPPEPNGFLHLGHAKSINLNFSLAKEFEGECFLRYDDTNPEKESQQFIDQIADNVLWMGFTPDRITYASDNFQAIYEFAVLLIKAGKAYVSEDSKEEMAYQRREKLPSSHRDRSVSENLRLFEEMKSGRFKENHCTLRLKIDFSSSNPTLRDPVAYRIKFHPHPRTGSQWCIYPTYDFTHCICDSLEHITHSYCSLEFEIRRDLYYWILDNLNLYKPIVFEMSRLNISHNFLSKRKIGKLIEMKLVEGWTDPRLMTLASLRRRGFTPEMIKEFCKEIGVSRRGNENVVAFSQLEACARKVLMEKAKKTMAVLDPVQLHIEGLQSEIFVEREDVFPTCKQKTKFLKEGEVFLLKNLGFFFCSKIESESGFLRVKAKKHDYDLNSCDLKAICHLHWISKANSMVCEVRVFEELLTSDENCDSENLESVFNSHSLKIYHKALLPVSECESLNQGEHLQFERLGFFTRDIENHNVFLRTVKLKGIN